MAAETAEQGLDLVAHNVRFLDEELRLHGNTRPRLATTHRVRLTLHALDPIAAWMLKNDT